MNYAKKTLIANILCGIAGGILLIIMLSGNLTSGFKNGMLSGLAGSFIILGVLGGIASFRLIKNPKKAKEIEIAKGEERTQFIRMKANSITHTIMVFVESFGAIVTGFIGYKEVTITIAVIIMIQTTIYIVSICYYSRKY